MKIIEIKSKDDILKLNLPKSVMTAGFFDGVHIGHQALINKARKEANKLKLPLILMTFWPYPKQFYQNITLPYPILTTLADKYEIFERLEVDYVLKVIFSDELKDMDPKKFVDFYIKPTNLVLFIAGVDFTFGKKDIADMDHLKTLSNGQFKVIKFPFLKLNNNKISSTKIRYFITNHQIINANKLLGRNYQTIGKVIHGQQIGRTLNFPTANINDPDNYLIPKDGVYFTKVKILNEYFWGITSVGNKPTFNGKSTFIETYILDFNKNIYGERIKIEWLYFHRPQIKFENSDQLKQKIDQDVDIARRYFKNK